MKKIFVDGSAGTTGLQIHERLSRRRDVEVLSIDEGRRKDPAARAELMNAADVVFLCLPDAAAVEAVGLIENPAVRVIDTSTAHRTAAGWVYGFPELGSREAVAGASRIANPGCHATGFISVVCPLVRSGLLPKEALLTCFSLTGYSGGGKKMIAEYGEPQRDSALDSPALYALGQQHKHLPEMQKYCGLAHPPVFCPVVADYYKGMATTVGLHAGMLSGSASVSSLHELYADFYAASPLIGVAEAPEARLYANDKAGTDGLRIVISGNGERFAVTALFDNLGKGASGAAIENMNIALGFPPETGLNP